MQGQQSREDVGLLPEYLQRPPLQSGVSIERQHQPRHPQRPQRQAAMLGLIRPQVARVKAPCQRYRMAERKAQPLSGDRIHGPGGIADQRDVTPVDAPQRAVCGNRTAFGRDDFCAAKPRVECGKRRQSLFDSQLRIVRGHSHADFFIANCRGITLTALSA